MKNSSLTQFDRQKAQTRPLLSLLFVQTAWVLVICVCVLDASARAQTVVGQPDQAERIGSRSWNWLTPFRMRNDKQVKRAAEPSSAVESASISDMPQQPSTVLPASAEAPVTNRVKSIEWPAQQASVPPELNREGTRPNKPGWLNWAPPKEEVSKETVEPSTASKQSNSVFNPFTWSNTTDENGLSKASAEIESNVTQQESRGFGPFAWTNTAKPLPANPQSQTQTREAYPVEKALDSAASVLPTKKELTTPLSWSNQADPASPPRPLEPPKQASFSESVQEALEWEDYTDEAEKKMLDDSRPPKDATVEEMIEWEKNKYPWIRPFYWEEDLNASMPVYEEFRDSTNTSAGRSRATAFMKPFLWTNEEPRTASSNVAQGDSRTVAYLQGEELPRPPSQSGTPGQEELPASKSDSDINLFESKQERKEREAREANEGSLAESDEEGKGAIGEAETLGREPVDNSLQFLRADTVLLDPGEAQFDYGMTYSLFDQTIPVIFSSNNGDSVGLARFRRREMVIPLEVRYGLTRRIQMFLNAPFGWSNAEFAIGPVEDFENDGGLGDIVFGGTFLMRQGDHKTSDAILTLAATAPTGREPFGLTTGLAPGGAALGGGTWSLASSMLFVRNYDPVVLFYGFGTRQHFLRQVNGVDFRAGGEYNYQLGVGFGVNEKITFSTRFNGAYVSETRLGGQRVVGSIQEPMVVSLAMTVAKDKKLMEPFVDFGLTDDTNDVRFGITWTR